MAWIQYIKDGVEYTKGSSTMDGDPTSYITQIQLYGEFGTPIAVANLSKPLKKDSTKEGVIKVQLSM